MVMKPVELNQVDTENKVHEEVQKIKDDFDKKLKAIKNKMC